MTLVHLLLLIPFIFAGALGIVTIQRALACVFEHGTEDRKRAAGGSQRYTEKPLMAP